MSRGTETYAYSWPITEEHAVRETHFTGHLRDALQCPDVFTYWHRHTHNWMVAVRFEKLGRSVMWELQVLNHDPEGNTPILTSEKRARTLSRWFRPLDPRDVSRGIKGEKNADLRRLLDEDRERLSHDQFLARHLANKHYPRLARNPSLSVAYAKPRIYA